MEAVVEVEAVVMGTDDGIGMESGEVNKADVMVVV